MNDTYQQFQGDPRSWDHSCTFFYRYLCCNDPKYHKADFLCYPIDEVL